MHREKGRVSSICRDLSRKDSLSPKPQNHPVPRFSSIVRCRTYQPVLPSLAPDPLVSSLAQLKLATRRTLKSISNDRCLSEKPTLKKKKKNNVHIEHKGYVNQSHLIITMPTLYHTCFFYFPPVYVFHLSLS